MGGTLGLLSRLVQLIKLDKTYYSCYFICPFIFTLFLWQGAKKCCTMLHTWKHFFVLQLCHIETYDNHSTVAIVYEWFDSLLFIISNISVFILSIWILSNRQHTKSESISPPVLFTAPL